MIRATLGLALVMTGLVLFPACHRSSSEAALGSSVDAAEPELRTLTTEEVAARIAARDGKTYIFDNNTAERYAEGHLPTAKWVAFNKVTAADLPADKTATLIFYCAGRS